MEKFRVISASASVEKNFEILNKDSKSVLLERLIKNPFADRSNKKFPGTVKKKGRWWCFYVDGEVRVYYHIEKKEKIVIIHFIGNHNGAMRFLQKYH